MCIRDSDVRVHALNAACKRYCGSRFPGQKRQAKTHAHCGSHAHAPDQGWRETPWQNEYRPAPTPDLSGYRGQDGLIPSSMLCVFPTCGSRVLQPGTFYFRMIAPRPAPLESFHLLRVCANLVFASALIRDSGNLKHSDPSTLG